MSTLDDFLAAIHSKKLVECTFDSIDEGRKTRICVPFDYGPWRRNMSPNPDRFHFYDLDSPDGKHNLSILPNQVISLKILNQDFEPGDYIKWSPNWFISRDWGEYS